MGLPAELFGGRGAGEVAESLRCCGRFSPCRWQTRADLCIMIDPVYRKLKVVQDSDRKAVGIEKELPVIIPFDDIADLAGEGITSIEDYLGIEKYPDET